VFYALEYLKRTEHGDYTKSTLDFIHLAGEKLKYYYVTCQQQLL